MSIDFSMSYVFYKVPIYQITLSGQTRIISSSDEVTTPIQTGSAALYVLD
jgi:hypothetical protein